MGKSHIKNVNNFMLYGGIGTTQLRRGEREKTGPPSYSTVSCCESANLTPNCPARARF